MYSHLCVILYKKVIIGKFWLIVPFSTKLDVGNYAFGSKNEKIISKFSRYLLYPCIIQQK